MEVSLHANMCDESTESISKELSRNYGGSMEHLWIDFELIESRGGKRAPFPFRFQKRVGGAKERLTGLPMPVYHNVGHYSVRPNFRELKRVPRESIVSYVLSEIYASTVILLDKQKRLGGFDAVKFRADYLAACHERGVAISESPVKKAGPLKRFLRLISLA